MLQTQQNDTTTYNRIRPTTKGKDRKPNHNKRTFQVAAAVCGTSSTAMWQVLPTTYSVLVRCSPSCRLLPAVVKHRGFPTTVPAPVPIPLDDTRKRSATLPVQFRLIVVPTRATENEQANES